MTIKAILFDKDGTLIEFKSTFAPATAKVLRDLAQGDEKKAQELGNAVGFDLETHTIAPDAVLIAGSLENISEALMKLTGDSDFEAFNAKVDALYVQHSMDSLSGFDFLIPTLDALEKIGLPLGVATNDSEQGAISHLTKLGITNRFCYIAGYDSGHGEKPGPGMVLAFAEHLGLDPSEVAMVGDSIHDLKAGRAAGALAVAVTSGLADADELSPHADHVMEDIRGMVDLAQQSAQ